MEGQGGSVSDKSPSPSRSGRKFRSIGDAVMEHAAENRMSTDDGIRFLELDGAITSGTINGAANLYLAALSIIENLQKKVTVASETQRPDPGTPEGHKARHVELHHALDELFADFISAHPGEHNFLDAPLKNLIRWSYEQTINPSEKHHDK